MTQSIDIRHGDKVLSGPVNERFLDIMGPCVLSGYRFAKGSAPFKLSLLLSGAAVSAAIAPTGARIEENVDLNDILTITPNADVAITRVDGIYMVYLHGSNAATATYEVVPGNSGTGVAQANPNPFTHTLLGYVNVMPNSADLVYAECFNPVPFGFSHLDVAGPARFRGDAAFDKPVTFNAPVTFMDGTTGGGGAGGTTGSSRTVRLPIPIIATSGQKLFNLPSKYAPNTGTLFVFVDWVIQSADALLELNETSFEFYEPMRGGEKVWAFWFEHVSLYALAPHSHDDLYYKKSEVVDRDVRYIQSSFQGPTGIILPHNLGHVNYVVLAITPTTRAFDVGQVAVEKRINDIIVYNNGAGRSAFDLSYVVKY